jgi:phthalate 4,5-cis-dihydrodiol dehydrogenase
LTSDRREGEDNRAIRLGVIGLGRAFTLMLPTFSLDPRVRLVAAYDPRPEACARFVADFAGAAHASAQSLCSDPGVQAVYIASPHQFHAEHVEIAARHGKHILVEKPMALTVADASAMIACAHRHQVRLLVGHSHSYDAPYLRARALISSDRYGAVRMVSALNYTDFLYRPRRPEELDTRLGGGVVFSQAAHQVDVVRLLVGSPAVTVRASTGNWDKKRPTEGAYSAHIQFANGAFASLTYSGYGRFDTDEFNGWVGELGQSRNPESYGTARAMLGQAHSQADETRLKERRAYGASTPDRHQKTDERLRHNHFGLIVVSCERADLRPVPDGVIIHDDTARWLDKLEQPTVPRAEVIDELCAAVIDGKAPLHSGEWGLATLEICTAILASAAADRTIVLEHQI